MCSQLCKHVCGRECRHAEKHHLCLFEKVFRGSRLIYRSRERIFVPTTRQHATAARLSEVLFDRGDGGGGGGTRAWARDRAVPGRQSGTSEDVAVAIARHLDLLGLPQEQARSR